MELSLTNYSSEALGGPLCSYSGFNYGVVAIEVNGVEGREFVSEQGGLIVKIKMEYELISCVLGLNGL